MAQHPFRGAFLASYWFGNETVKELRERLPAGKRAELTSALFHGVQSIDSLHATFSD